MSKYFKEGLSEFWASKTSKIGLAFLSIIIIISMYTLFTFPLDYGTRYWNNPKYWADNPKIAMPEWINFFVGNKFLEHKVLSTSTVQKIYPFGAYYIKTYEVVYDLMVDQFPTFITLKFDNVTFFSRPPTIEVLVIRPDNSTINLYRSVVEPPLPTEEPPYSRYVVEPKRIMLSGEPQLSLVLSNFLLDKYNLPIDPKDVAEIGYEKVIFGEPYENGFKPLKGRYVFTTVLYARDVRDQIGTVSIVIGGQVYGFMGTDILGRDLSQGLLFGFPVALLIGVVVSVLTTMIGATLGIVSGYIGGRADEIIQRVCDVMNNIPQLPILIFLTFIFGGKLWIIVVILVLFGWPSLVIVVRSMVLQARSSSFIEAAISIGASRWRIMIRHIFPQVAPYILAQMIFFTPSAILAEAALSFLGLGDPSIPTWGQILEYGFRNGAVFLGYWWWVLPPGLMIVFSAITFVFIALGFEPVINPRLRRWR
ncbi:MAG: ABC transporter permease subunit [Candidatus Nezhaarchaeales archaeon]